MTLSFQTSIALASLLSAEAFVTDKASTASRQASPLYYQHGAMMPDNFEEPANFGFGFPDMHGPHGAHQPGDFMGEAPATAFREDFLQTADMRMKQPTGGSFRPIANDHTVPNDWNMPGGFEHPPMGMGNPFEQHFQDNLMPVGANMNMHGPPFQGHPGGMEHGPDFMFPPHGEFPGGPFPGQYEPPFEQNQQAHSRAFDGRRNKVGDKKKKNIL